MNGKLILTARRWRNKRIKEKKYIFEQIVQKIYFFVLLFCLLLHRLAVRISFPFIFFYKFNCTDPGLQLRRDGSTQRFIGCRGLADILYILESSRHCPFRNHKGKTNTKSITAKTDVSPHSSPLGDVSRGGTLACVASVSSRGSSRKLGQEQKKWMTGRGRGTKERLRLSSLFQALR